MNITKIVKDNTAKFAYYRTGTLYYNVVHGDGSIICMFPIDTTDTNDIGNATFNYEHKAINLMRYIRKAIDANTIVMFKEEL
jgi:hypothetical protein